GLAPPAPVPLSSGQRISQGGLAQALELGHNDRPLPGRISCARGLSRPGGRPRDDVRAGLLHAAHRRALHAARDAPAAWDDRNDPTLRVPTCLVRALRLGVDPPLPADPGSGPDVARLPVRADAERSGLIASPRRGADPPPAYA